MNAPLTNEERPKPCPFCGAIDAPEVFSHSEIYDREDEDDSGNDESFVVCCDFHNGGCGASGPYDIDKGAAVRFWNRRANEVVPALKDAT